ncbi:MAG: translation elongation factor EF-1 subunit alpha [Candidatus Lokiarchaeota archaeon]|nr:translation elongation factor EF-1 subunit alpha [Candidatus Lokiarchaeota archaeon]
MSKKTDKPHLNLVIMGHIDHGKSTTMGHLLIVTGAITDREMRQMEELSSKLERASWKYAFVFDRLKEERERGITIDLAFREFDTNNYYFTIIDAPGHRDFVKNAITGASQADACILVVSAKRGEFEAGISAGGQTVEHAYLARTLGIGQLIVAINKMDDPSVNYSEERYKEVQEEIQRLCDRIPFPRDKVTYLPMSGYVGSNLDKPEPKMAWWKGLTLVGALDNLQVPEKPIDKPLRIPVQDVYKITGIGTVPVGKIETGVLKVGDKIVFMPSGKETECRSIEMHHKQMQKAEAGDNIGFNIRALAVKDIKRGDMVGLTKEKPTVAEEMTAQLIIIFHPTAVTAGYTPVIHAHTAQVACTFMEIVSKFDPKTGQPIQDKPDFLKQDEGGIVKMKPVKPLCIEKLSDFPQLGRFAIRDSGRTVGVGVVKDLKPRA